MATHKQPLFGILTTATAKRILQNHREPHFHPAPGWNTLEQDAHALGLRACWFRPCDVDRQNGRLHAWVCDRSANGSRRWRRIHCPLPGAVYENVPVPVRSRDDVMQLKRYFRRQGIPVFNPPLGTKPQLGQWLKKYPSLYRHHPETIFNPRPQDVITFLNKHRFIYLKPCLGRGGHGIIEISTGDKIDHLATSPAPYRVRASLYGPQQRPLDRILTRSALLFFLQTEFTRHRYLLQAGCDLLKIDRCKIDLRAHMQRNKQGQWECIGLVVKQGKANAIVSNYHLGGALHPWEWLQQRATRQATPLPSKQQVIDLAKRFAAAYTAKAPTLGSLGFDLGIDRSGRIWLLDVNSPPSRNLLGLEQRRRAQRLCAEFACYLLKEKGRR